MHRTALTICTAAFIAAWTGAAPAQQGTGSNMRYRWRDAQGLPHYSDSLTTEALKYGYDLVNDQGLVVQHVERQLSPEERVAAKKKADALAAQQRVADEAHRVDMQMLSAYPTEASYRQAQQQELATQDQQIATSRIGLVSQQKALADLLARGADLERAKQPVPKTLADSIAQQRKVVADLRAATDRQQAVRDAAAKAIEGKVARYRAVQAADRTPPAS